MTFLDRLLKLLGFVEATELPPEDAASLSVLFRPQPAPGDLPMNDNQQTIQLEIELPRIPDSFKTTAGARVAVESLDEKTIRRLCNAWTEKVVANAADRRKARTEEAATA